MTKDEALKLALDALELHGKQYPHMVKGYCIDAITAIKEALAQPAQEPVEWLTGCPECGMDSGCDCDSGTCNPPQRPWVGLTDKERAEIQRMKWWDWEDTFDLDGFTHSIEAKLKDKNHDQR